MSYPKSLAIAILIACIGIIGFQPNSWAQETTELPELPKPIQNLVNEGAQIRYLGRDNGMDGWLTIKNGQEQYFYVTPDRSAFVMGILFDDNGKAVTVRQVKALRETGDTDFLDTLAGESLGVAKNSKAGQADSFEFKSPSEQLYYDIENSNWVPLGNADAPFIYAFIDPQCPHCHAFINDLLQDEILQRGLIQVRMIPIGLTDETRAQAAFLLSAPNPQERWLRHMDGDETALLAKNEINQQGVQRNLAIMHSWKLDVTPLIVYRGNNGSVKIVQGRPEKLETLTKELGIKG